MCQLILWGDINIKKTIEKNKIHVDNDIMILKYDNKKSKNRELSNNTVNQLINRLLSVAKPLKEATIKDIIYAYRRTGVYVFFDPVDKRPAYIGKANNFFDRTMHHIDGELYLYYEDAEKWELLLGLIQFGDGDATNTKTDSQNAKKLEKLLISTLNPIFNTMHKNTNPDNPLLKYLNEEPIGTYMKS